MARRAEFGEHVDDHQLELARRMEASGLVTFVEDRDALGAALAAESSPAGRMTGVPWLGDDLTQHLAGTAGAAGDPGDAGDQSVQFGPNGLRPW